MQETTKGKSELIGKEILSEHLELLVTSERFVVDLFCLRRLEVTSDLCSLLLIFKVRGDVCLTGNNYFHMDAKLQSLQLLISFHFTLHTALLPTYRSNVSEKYGNYTRQISVGDSAVTTARHDTHLVV